MRESVVLSGSRGLVAEMKLTDIRSPGLTPGVTRRPNLKALTSVRFFAALHVALFHLVSPFSLWGPFVGVASSGYMAVSFFFLLSGFILTYSHADAYEKGNESCWKFWTARLARIYPVYLLSLIIAGALAGRYLRGKPLVAYIADLLAIQSWSIRVWPFFNPPAWSISVEAFFYLVFPFVLMRLRPSSRRAALLSMSGFWALAMALPLYCVMHFPAVAWVGDIPGPGEAFIWNVRRLPIIQLPEFLAGICLGWYYLRFRPSVRAASWMILVALPLLAVCLLLSRHLPHIMLHNGLLFPLFAMLLLGLAEESNLLSHLLSNPVLVLLGEASFSLYLFHSMFAGWTEHFFGWHRTIPNALCNLAVVIPVSVLLHLGVERPCRRLVLTWWHKRHPKQLAMVAEQAEPTLSQ